MLEKWLWAFLSASFSLWALDFEELIHADRDLTFFHHVHVISGSLNLSVDEWLIEGQVPIAIRKTYNSLGALQRSKSDFDLRLKELRGGFLLQGGWDVFSYTNLLVYENNYGTLKAYVADPSGSMMVFDRNFDTKAPYTLLKTQPTCGFVAGVNSAMTFYENYSLYVDQENGTAILILPNGAKRTYFRTLSRSLKDEIAKHNVFYRLVEEVLPSGHIIDYFYDEKKRLSRIETKSCDRSIIFSILDFDLIQSKPPITFSFKGSDGSKFSYKAINFEGRDYLSSFSSVLYGTKQFEYEPGRKHTGAFLKKVIQDGLPTLEVEYYKPKSIEEERVLAKDETCKRLEIDKVKKIYFPSHQDGQMKEFAEFFYQPTHTDVKDSKGKWTCYHHDGEKLLKIEYCDQNHTLQSAILLLWDNKKLIAKILLDEKEKAIFSKTFSYDEFGNVLKEVLYGNLTGDKDQSFDYLESGELIGADCHAKEFIYSLSRNLLLQEKEEEGICKVYEYLEDTNLLQAKYTLDHDKILKREFFYYDQHHLLIDQTVDDGDHFDPCNLDNATFFSGVRFLRNSHNGKVIEKIAYVKDLKTLSLQQKERIVLSYGDYFQVIKEEKYDTQNQLQLVVHNRFNAAGLLTEKKDNYGRLSLYTYNHLRQLLTKKEWGSSLHSYTYTPQGLVKKITIDGQDFDILYAYDDEGNPIFKQDERGCQISQSFDSFHRVKAIFLGPAQDENKNVYQPSVEYRFDAQGNIIFQKDHLGSVVEQVFNTYRKPVKVIQKDGSTTYYRYAKNGQLLKTTHPDQSYTTYSYDSLGRMVEIKNFDAFHQLLWDEKDVYGTFFLKAKQDKNKRWTFFTYDIFGQKISEKTEGLTKEFTYDTLGRLHSESDGLSISFTEYNAIDQKKKSFIQNASGQIFSDTNFFYDDEGRLSVVKKMTSSGVAVDTFTYDALNRLISHQDPLQNVTVFSYRHEQIDSFFFFIKETIDPLGRIKKETYDLYGKILSSIQLAPDGKKLLETQFFYDQAGNQVQAIVTNPDDDHSKVFSFSYDCMGRRIHEVSSDQIKSFSYDKLGQLQSITYPSFKQVFYVFDSAGRLKEVYTSCGKIHYRYHYEAFDLPICIEDVVNRSAIYRSYNSMGQLIQEIDEQGHHQRWVYDKHQRLVKSILPDRSWVEQQYDGVNLKLLERYQQDGKKRYAHEFSHYNLSGRLEREKYGGKAFNQIIQYDLLDRPIAQYNNLFFQENTIDSVGQIIEYRSNLNDKKYSYDFLGQLKNQAENPYGFDSFGNLEKSLCDNSNRLLQWQDYSCDYDLDGNLIKKSSPNGVVKFYYDGLQRLVEMEENGLTTRFFYDPLSRLSKIERSSENLELFYHFFEEVGAIKNGVISELKISACHLNQEKPELLYLEKGAEVFIPVVDLVGSIQAIYHMDGELAEAYGVGPFGETDSKDTLFSYQLMGKRRIGSIYYFGVRFLDSELKRWLTQDPLGYQDGFNLYAFVWNSPTCRIDLFGFSTEGIFPYDVQIYIPTQFVLDVGDTNGTITVAGSIGGSKVDWVVSCGHWHQMKFTPEELEANQANLFDHLTELLPQDGAKVGLITIINGINTTKKEFEEIQQSVYQNVPEGTLTIGLHNPTHGIGFDLMRVSCEILGIKETKNVIMTRQFMESFADMFGKINPLGRWIHVAHSEGGLITYNAIKTMNPDRQKMIQEQLDIVAIAPARPIPNHFAQNVSNIYSDQDFFLAGVGKIFSLHHNYSINFLPAISKFVERSAYFADHAFLGSTYQTAIQLLFAQQRSCVQFHTANK